MCFILYFVIIVFVYNAFYSRLVFVGLILYFLYNFFSLDDRITINFVFRDNILKISIFRRFIRILRYYNKTIVISRKIDLFIFVFFTLTFLL